MSLWSKIADRPRWVDPDAPTHPDGTPIQNKYSKNPEQLHGNIHHVDEYFQGNATRPCPWPSVSAGGTAKATLYDKSLVHDMLRNRPHDLEEVDPRTLTATQPSITRGGTKHYLESDYHVTGQTFEGGANPGNAHPVIFQHENGQNYILSGHHRAARALFTGQPLRARVVRGGSTPRV